MPEDCQEITGMFACLRLCVRPETYTHRHTLAAKWICQLMFNHSMQQQQQKVTYKMWLHNILYSHNPFPHNVSCVPMPIFIGFDIFAGTSTMYYIRREQKKISRGMFEYSNFPQKYFLLNEWPLLAHYIWIWYSVCVFFTKGGQEKKTITGAKLVVVKWCGWCWCETFEKFLTIMMSIS